MKSVKIVPKSTVQLLYWLSSGKLVLNPLWQKTSYRWKFLLRSIVIYPQSLRWLKHLSQYPLLGLFLSRQTNLPCKLHRPYLSSVINSRQGCDALIYHYDFLSTKPLSSFCQKTYAQEPLLLATIVGKNEQQLTIELIAEDRYGREGELTLFIYNSEHILLSCLTFSFIHYQNKSTLFIGGLQGTASNVDHQAIQEATKACHGLFPKRVLVEVASYLAQTYAIEQITAVGNKTHIYNNWRYKRQQKQIFSDYDNFWLSLDAVEDNHQLFQIPLVLKHKPLEEVASKKRAEYRRRYELLESLKQQVVESIC